MAEANSTSSTLRALLILGRVSNLPTVWSNCLAGWLLGGGGDLALVLRLCVGATLLYVGGMYLNDAFDADFDRRHRQERPIPAGVVSEVMVWGSGLGLLLSGAVVLGYGNWQSAVYAVVLAMTVLAYDAVHKHVDFAPLLMAACRLELIQLSASAGVVGVTGLAMWNAVVMACYVIGLSALARREATAETFGRWPLWLLGAPIVLALVVNDGEMRQSALILSFLFGGYVLMSLRPALRRVPPDIGASVSLLLAGIPLVDLLSVGVMSPDILGQGWTPWTLVGVFGGCTLLSRVAQRFIPAT